MDEPTRFQPGDHIAIREYWAGRIWWASPAILVEDSDDVIAFFTRPGAVGKAAAWTNYDEALEMIASGDWNLTDRVFHTNRRLGIARPGEPYAVSAFWRDDDCRFLGWYVDVIVPLRRSAVGFDMRDLELDIVIAEDLSSWQWKDEEALEARVRRGLHDKKEAAEIRSVGEGVVSLIERGDAWWTGWREWAPDLPIPVLPERWDVADSALASGD